MGDRSLGSRAGGDGGDHRADGRRLHLRTRSRTPLGRPADLVAQAGQAFFGHDEHHHDVATLRHHTRPAGPDADAGTVLVPGAVLSGATPAIPAVNSTPAGH